MSRARDLADLIGGGFTEADIPNLSASKITSGTFADARIAASNVSQHAQSFDDNKIINDISTLGLRVHTQENLNASNTNSASFDVFQDSSGITNLVTAQRNASEFIETVVDTTTDTSVTINSSNFTTYLPFDTSRFSYRKNTSGITSYSGAGNLFDWSAGNTADFYNSSGIDANQVLQTSSEQSLFNAYFNVNGSTSLFLTNNNDTSGLYNNRNTNFNYALPSGNSIKINGSVTSRWQNGAGSFNAVVIYGVDSNFNGTNIGEHSSYTGGVSNGSTFTINVSNSTFYPAFTILVQHTGNNAYMLDSFSIPCVVRQVTQTINATGSFEGVAITAPSSTNKMGAVITYQDQAGTNALNTDIILDLSCDNGSNYTRATLTALPDFSTGIKMAKVNDLSIGTAGTQLKYKISFANQASGSKEARIRGVSLQY